MRAAMRSHGVAQLDEVEAVVLETDGSLNVIGRAEDGATGSVVARLTIMLLVIATILAVGWVLGFAVFHVASFAIHFLIAAAVIAVIVHFVKGAAKD